MQILYPTEISEVKQKTIFLAGPIRGAADWQSELCESFSDTELVFANPRRVNMSAQCNWDKQVEWETFYLNNSDIIVFWLPGESEHIPGRDYAQTTRFELGEWLAKSKYQKNKRIIVGVADEIYGKRYFAKRIRDGYPNVYFCDTFDEVKSKLREYTMEGIQ